MSYDSVISALHTALSAVEGIKYVQVGQPDTVQTTPLLYSMLDSFERSRSGQVVAMRYRTLHRLVVMKADGEQSEAELIPFVNTVPAAIDANPQLSGALDQGMAAISDADSLFVTIGGVEFRAIDFYSDVVEKFPYQSAGL